MIEIKDLKFSYENNQVFDNLNIKFETKKSYAIIGKSGSGKTTLLRLIVGLEDTKEGSVLIDGEKVNGKSYIPIYKRGVAIVFQDYALFPHMNVKKNILYGMKNSKDLDKITSALGIENLLYKRIYQLSGGEQQRVALARALIRKPKYLLMDEPFSNLDLEIKNYSIELVKNLCKENNITLIMNSHNHEDYDDLVDEIIDLNQIK